MKTEGGRRGFIHPGSKSSNKSQFQKNGKAIHKNSFLLVRQVGKKASRKVWDERDPVKGVINCLEPRQRFSQFIHHFSTAHFCQQAGKVIEYINIFIINFNKGLQYKYPYVGNNEQRYKLRPRAGNVVQVRLGAMFK